MSYEPLKDFAPVALLIRGPQIFVATPKPSVKSFTEFVAQAKARPGSIRYATAGPATSSRLSVELFKAISKLDGTTIFFKGGGPALNDLLGGHVDVMIASAGLVLSHVNSGRLLALAVSSKNRVIIQRLNADVNKVLAEAEVKDRFATFGYEMAGSSPEQFGEWLRTESLKWGKVIRDNNITAE